MMQDFPKKRVVWLVLDHPWQLFLALAIVRSSPNGLQYNLISSRHKYWSKVNPNMYRNNFERIDFFDEPKRAANFLDAFRFLFQANKLKAEIAKLPIKPSDTVLTLCYYTCLENILTSVFSSTRQIFLMRDDVYQIFNIFGSNLRTGAFREAKSSLLHRKLLEPLLGLKKRTRFVWINTPENFHDLTLQRRPEDYYDKVFRLRLQTAAELSPDELYYPYPFLLRALKKPSARKRIVFFLSDYIKNPDYYQKISKILQFLAASFGNNYRLELRTHPNRPEEYKAVNTAGWELNAEDGSAEEYLLAHHKELAYAMSHVSTVLLFAAQLGIPAYTYYRLFGFTRQYQAIFDRFYRDMPKEFFMTDFAATPQPYVMPVGKDAILNSLNKLYQALGQ